MGVPCITMAGSVHAHNVGVSLLTKVGEGSFAITINIFLLTFAVEFCLATVMFKSLVLLLHEVFILHAEIIEITAIDPGILHVLSGNCVGGYKH